ncbi:MAG: ATP-binding cassette domain-containing protein [Clostridia bacterium]|nr:ATP-binding cassette domain-containing protein [Clostridia bacterium]
MKEDERVSEGTPIIQIRGLSKTFVTDHEIMALRNIDLDVQKGDIFGIIGMSGAGKSTLLRCIALLETPTSGTIEIEGRDISTLRGRDLIALRKQIGVIFQGYHLLMQRTVRRNIAFPLELEHKSKEEIARRTDELLEIVGLSDKANAYPSQLSGGQKQRVAIARALASNPKIILCDEPTSALDSVTTKSILQLLTDINRNLGVSVMIITHEIGVVRAICNKVAVINDGLFVEQGEMPGIFQKPTNAVTRLLLGLGEEDE